MDNDKPEIPSEELDIDPSLAPMVTEEQLIEIARSQGLLDSEFEPGAAAAEAGPVIGIETVSELLDDSGATARIELSEEQRHELMASIETVLFMSDKPVSLPKLRATINAEIPLSVYRELMAALRTEFSAEHRGVDITEVALGFQLRTKPQMAQVLRRMVKTQPLKLSPATMEVLAVVAYKQPATKDDVDSIRGVDSGHILRSLMERRLVRITGRSELPGRPMLYGTTHEFLELFNLKDSRQLPPLHEIEAMVATSEVGFEEKQMQVTEDFGKMVESNTRILFDDSKIDDELEALRTEIAAIPTSTTFIDEQKAQEKLAIRTAELASRGLMLDAEGNEVPLGSVPAIEPGAEIVAAPEIHQPSPELEAQAAAAQAERHAEMLGEAIGETQQAALEDAASPEQALSAPVAIPEPGPAPESGPEPEPEPELY